MRATLVDRFGGLTAYTRNPADGVWKPSGGKTADHDEIVIYEVMAPQLDREWWRHFREKLERVFHQESLVIRANEVVVL